MTARQRRKALALAGVTALAAWSLGCRYGSVSDETLARRTMVVAPGGPLDTQRREVAKVELALEERAATESRAKETPARELASTEAVGEATPSRPELLATYFPPTHRSTRAQGTVVLFDPVFLRKEVLYRGRDGGLVPFLNLHGYPVWVVFARDYRGHTMDAMGDALADALGRLAQKPGTTKLHVGGLSLGGEAVARALDGLVAQGRIAALPPGKVFFVGAGVDYAYPSSFAEQAKALRDRPALALCAAQGGPSCRRYLEDGAEATPWLGYLPRSEGAEQRPAAQRFPHLRSLRRPALFVSGKSDGICPSESLYPLYELYGADTAEARRIPKWFLFAGRENRFARDYDQFALFGAPSAEDDVYEALRRWLERP